MSKQDQILPMADYVWSIAQVPDSAINDLAKEVGIVLESVFGMDNATANEHAKTFAEDVRADQDGLGLMSLHSTPLQIASSFAGAYDRPLSDDELARYDALTAERSTLQRSA